jgi:hypothetical protein
VGNRAVVSKEHRLGHVRSVWSLVFQVRLVFSTLCAAAHALDIGSNAVLQRPEQIIQAWDPSPVIVARPRADTDWISIQDPAPEADRRKPSREQRPDPERVQLGRAPAEPLSEPSAVAYERGSQAAKARIATHRPKTRIIGTIHSVVLCADAVAVYFPQHTSSAGQRGIYRSSRDFHPSSRGISSLTKTSPIKPQSSASFHTNNGHYVPTDLKSSVRLYDTDHGDGHTVSPRRVPDKTRPSLDLGTSRNVGGAR